MCIHAHSQWPAPSTHIQTSPNTHALWLWLLCVQQCSMLLGNKAKGLFVPLPPSIARGFLPGIQHCPIPLPLRMREGQSLGLLSLFTQTLATKIPCLWPKCLYQQAQLPCPFPSVHLVVWKKPTIPSYAGKAEKPFQSWGGLACGPQDGVTLRGQRELPGLWPSMPTPMPTTATVSVQGGLCTSTPPLSPMDPFSFQASGKCRHF